MVRTSSKKGEKIEKPHENDESKERKRLKQLAFSKNLLSQTPTQGLLAPLSGGKVGELKDLGTKNPILYMDFPQGRMKLFGTIVYPKNKYLSMHFGRTAKSVMCEDIFESMIVFSDAWWIGKIEENPDELQLEFPRELNEGKPPDYDFKGGAGAVSEGKSGIDKVKKGHFQTVSPESESKDEISVDSDPLPQKKLNGGIELTPVRHSARTAGKKFKFAESSSGDDNASSDDTDICSAKEEKENDEDGTLKPTLSSKTIASNVIEARVHASDNEEVKIKTALPQGLKRSSKSKERTSEVSNKKGRRVQPTLSTLFEKVDEKRSTSSTKDPPSPKGSARKVSAGSKKATKHTEGLKSNKADKRTPRKQKYMQVEDDEIEEASSESQGTDGSDKDWAA